MPPSLQVAKFEDEEGTALRASLLVNGGPDRVWTHTLAVFTGSRFLRSARHDSAGLTFSPEDAEVAACVLAMMQVIPSTVLAVTGGLQCAGNYLQRSGVRARDDAGNYCHCAGGCLQRCR